MVSMFVMCVWWCPRETKIPFFFLYHSDELPAQKGAMDQRHPWVQGFSPGPLARQGTAGNICIFVFPFPVTAGWFAAWFGFSCPSLSQKLAGQESEETETRRKGPFALCACFSQLQNTSLSPRLQARAILLLHQPGCLYRLSFSQDIPNASSALRVPSSTCTYGCSGAALELRDGVMGGQGVVRRRR